MVEDTQKRYADDITVQELVRLRVANEKLREALKFYADKQNYEDRLYGQWPKVRDDEGGIARAALKGGE